MKKVWAAAAIALAAVTMTTVSFDAEARRMGGGKATGMQRQATPPSAPAQQMATRPATSPAAAPAAAGAAAKSRSWMGPLAGLAAGLGLAALFSSMGLGGELANFVMMALLAVVAFAVIRFLMARFANKQNTTPAGMQMAGAGAPMNMHREAQPSPAMAQPTAFSPLNPVETAPSASAAPVSSAPQDFDGPAFERIAKLLFIRLQAANDAAQIDDLRKFTTPEMFAALRLDIQERGTAAQQTDVVQLQAQLQDVVQETHQGSTVWVASVRFEGLIREEANEIAQPFNEFWHFVRPADSNSAEWLIAGITPANSN